MKKAIALLVAAMLLTGLSACGGSTTADAPAKSDGTFKDPRPIRKSPNPSRPI